MDGKIRLFHYTTKEGKKAIRDSGVIKESKKSGAKDDARFGNGVYLTSLAPSNGKIELYRNNYDGLAENVRKYINWPKVDCYVEVKLDENAVEVMDDERDIYLHRGDLKLSEDVIVSFGDVTRK